jgi:hypothetical protein
MTGDDLDKPQTQKMADALFPSINYLVRLKQRMHAQGFEPGDPLLVLTEKAYDSVQNLYLDLLNRSASGNMRPRPAETKRDMKA